MKDEDIKKILQRRYNYLINNFKDCQVIGIFAYGLTNYGLAETSKEIQTVACICPTFEEFCCQKQLLQPYYIKDNFGEDIRITDIRLLYQKVLYQESVVLEAIFTDYCIINPRYKKIFNKYIYMNREAVFHTNQRLRIEQALRIGQSALLAYKNSETKDAKDLLKVSYIRISCRQYLNGVSCENCVNLKQDYYKNYLLQIKHNNFIPDIEEIEEDFNSILEEIKDLPTHVDYDDIVETSIVEIIKIALTDLLQETDFENLLTKTENQALEMIISALEDGREGTVSIAQLTNNCDISRPVFKNVLQKMKDNMIAEIENQGVKGTYIKIIDGHLLSNH